ncbi:aluminum-activated malate transporter 10-like [Canna indica]|uniref:Aluminum-activated malate transporter 10-like n=1 Tax=Canna indica TaxID=4628 RepID=A0AAQ3Q763_9LILI|nr:aluminum-activated malate transporter 10-like [Canna indica]
MLSLVLPLSKTTLLLHCSIAPLRTPHYQHHHSTSAPVIYKYLHYHIHTSRQTRLRTPFSFLNPIYIDLLDHLPIHSSSIAPSLVLSLPSAMATGREAVGGAEWRVSIPEGSTAKMQLEPSCSWISRARTWLVSLATEMMSKPTNFGKNAWKMGADDPRKVIHGVKVGIALALVSLFYYTRPLYDGVGGCAMWAVMTVVVVFEYTVGGCLYKGLNRALATTTAGALAVGVHWIASKSGEKMEPIILSGSVFVLASAATFSRFIPNIKARFDYGITIFILTFSLVAVSGYRVDQLLQMAQQRVYTIFIGFSMSLLVCILVRPVWAGQELHLLLSRNMAKLADSLESLTDDYFTNAKDNEGKGSPALRSKGYKCVLNSKGSEDSQANLARWEPGHGRFRFRHPWGQYLKLGAAIRRCAYCVEALDACIGSDRDQSPAVKSHLRDVCLRLSRDSSKVLKQLSSSFESMKESPSIGLLVGEMNDGVKELGVALRSLPRYLTREAADEIDGDKKQGAPSATATVSVFEAMPLMAVASLLMQVSERVEEVVEAVAALAKLASFETARDHKKSSSSSSSMSSVVPRDEESDSVKPSQEV